MSKRQRKQRTRAVENAIVEKLFHDTALSMWLRRELKALGLPVRDTDAELNRVENSKMNELREYFVGSPPNRYPRARLRAALRAYAKKAFEK